MPIDIHRSIDFQWEENFRIRCLWVAHIYSDDNHRIGSGYSFAIVFISIRESKTLSSWIDPRDDGWSNESEESTSLETEWFQYWIPSVPEIIPSWSNNTSFVLLLENSSISRQVSIYLNTFTQVGITIQSTSKFVVIEDFRRLLLSIGFKQIDAVSNGYLRIDEGNLFEHAVIQLVNADEFMTDDDLLVHFYTE